LVVVITVLEVLSNTTNKANSNKKVMALLAQVYIYYLFYESLVLAIQPGGGVVGAPIPLGRDANGPPKLEEEDDLELIDTEVDKRWRDERRKRESTET